MWQQEVFFLSYKINYNIFKLHYSLLKEPKLQKRASKYSKMSVERVWIHFETGAWYDKNIQTVKWDAKMRT